MVSETVKSSKNNQCIKKYWKQSEMMKQYNLCVANYNNWLLNHNIIKLLDLKRVITKIKREKFNIKNFI